MPSALVYTSHIDPAGETAMATFENDRLSTILQSARKCPEPSKCPSSKTRHALASADTGRTRATRTGETPTVAAMGAWEISFG